MPTPTDPKAKPDSKLLNMKGITVARGNTVHHGLDARGQAKTYAPGESPPFEESDADDVIRLIERGVLVDANNVDADGNQLIGAAGKSSVPKDGNDKEKDDKK
jgi:hypothetical protein